jgi:hypothetical protein
MPQLTRYYPSRIGDQIVWLRNLRNKLPNYQAALGYTAAQITAIQGDIDRIIWLLETVQTSVQSFAPAVTTHIDIIQNGTGTALVPLPTFAIPASPVPPANVLPGALKRVFAFVANMKTLDACTDDIATDLQIASSTTPDDPNAVPPASGEARSGEVVITFKNMGHMGVWVEGQVGAETDWTFLAIDTSNPYNDTRPLKVAGQPEKRRYRLCFWDGDPTKVWTDVIEVVFGG